MLEFLILREIGLIMVAAAVGGILARRVGLPPLLAYMVVGLILGPATGLVDITEDVALVSEVGIALLLFLVGLELSVATLREVGRAAVLAGGGQAVVTALAGLGLALFLGFTLRQGFFIAAALTFSSTVVAVKLLEERRELATTFGRIALGILLLQDLAAVLLLTVLSALGGDAPERGLLSRLAVALLGTAVLTAAALVLATRVLAGLFHWLSRQKQALFVCSLAWCFVFIVLAARLGLSVEIGAFVAGVGLAQLPWNQELRRQVHPLASFFVAVFFVSLGLRMQLDAAFSRPIALLVLTIFVLLVKPFALYWLLSGLRHGAKTAFMASVTLAQVSEFSLIVVALAADRGLIGVPTVSLIGALALVTTGVSATVLQNADAWFERFLRLRPPRRGQPEPPAPPGRRDHVIVVGMNTLGRLLVRQLAARGEQVLAIDTNPGKLVGLPAEVLIGNAGHTSVLHDADHESARLLISALQIEDMNTLLAYRCRVAGVPCAIHAFDAQVVTDLRQLEVDYLMVSKHDGIRQMVEGMRRVGVVR